MVIMDELSRLLEDCERSIDLEHYKKTEALLKKCLRYEETDTVCMKAVYPQDKYQLFSMEEIHSDIQKMMYNEIVSFAGRLDVKDTTLPMLRANYGVGIVPSLFGLKCRIVNNNMPWVDHVGQDEVKNILKRGLPDYRSGYGARVIETYETFKEILSKYPKCSQAIKLYCPDHQGPFDIAHLIYGSDIYMDLYDEPELVQELLDLVTETYIDTVKHIKPYLSDETGDGFCYQWGNIFPGSILIRNDSAVNLSPSMYLEFVKPYDERIMDAFGNVAMHYCGRADQWIHEMAKSDRIAGYNFGHVPSLKYGMEFLDYVEPSLMKNKKPIVAYVLEKKELDEMDFKKYHTGITYEMQADSLEDAKRLIQICNEKLHAN